MFSTNTRTQSTNLSHRVLVVAVLGGLGPARLADGGVQLRDRGQLVPPPAAGVLPGPQLHHPHQLGQARVLGAGMRARARARARARTCDPGVELKLVPYPASDSGVGLLVIEVLGTKSGDIESTGHKDRGRLARMQ